jgi:hypothetical protein
MNLAGIRCAKGELMKLLATVLFALVTGWLATAHAQGTFVYDQQSSDENYIAGITGIQGSEPGQSFTPTLSSVGFVRLALGDTNPGNSLGATVVVNLRAGSITGSIIGISSPVSMPDGFNGVTNLFFSTPVAVTPGVTYYFQPVIQTGGDFWLTRQYNSYNYPGGMLFYGSTPAPNFDMWFREGQYVPEPSALALAGLAISCFTRRRHKAGRR